MDAVAHLLCTGLSELLVLSFPGTPLDKGARGICPEWSLKHTEWARLPRTVQIAVRNDVLRTQRASVDGGRNQLRAVITSP